MSRCTVLMFMAWVLIVLGNGSRLYAQNDPVATPAAESPELVLPLVYRSPTQRVLLLLAQEKEATSIKNTLRESKIKFDHQEWFNPTQKDYSSYHLVVGGSNCMDAWATATEPAAFEPLERFVAEGGHLLLLGTFNGRNCEHLRRFGIQTGVSHSLVFRTVPGRSEVLFKGFEATVPVDRKITAYGHFTVSTPHVVFLQRDEAISLPDGPVLATLAYKKGRVTYTQLEPNDDNDLWLITALLTWAVRGGPTVVGQLDQQVVFDEQEILERRKLPVPSDSELQVAEQVIREKMRDDITLAATSVDKFILGDRLVQMSLIAADPVTKFASLQMAKDFYAESTSPVKAFEVIRQLQLEYQLDVGAMSLESARTLSEKIQDPAGSAEFAKACLDLADDLADNGRYDVAISLAELAKTAAQTGKHRHYQSLIPPLTRRLAVLQKESDRIQTFRERLKTDDKDAEANLEVGKFQCLFLRHWDRGLPQLARGSDEALRQLAEAEIKGTDDPNAQVALAEMWNVQSKKQTATARAAAQSRARTWYWRAISKSSGSERTALERKADRIFTNKFELRLAFRNDGHSELNVSPDRLVWKSLEGSAPTSIQANAQYWPVASHSELKNHGSTRYFLEDVDLETAEIVQVRGPVKVALTSITPEQLVIDLNGNKDVEFVIKFGR